MKIRVAAAAGIGFAIGILCFAIGREIARIFLSRPASTVLGDTLTAVGSLKWIDTTLVTGLAAVLAAGISIREVRRQIRSSENDVQTQIDLTSRIERDRGEAKLAANRSILPLTLASLSQYVEKNAQRIEVLCNSCSANVLPRRVPIPAFAELPSEAISSLKEMVEVVNSSQRQAFSKLLRDIQVESSRLADLSNRNRRGTIIFRTNLDSHIVGLAAISARLSAMYRFGRGRTDIITSEISKHDIRSALMILGVHSVREEIIEKYGLDVDEIWDVYDRD